MTLLTTACTGHPCYQKHIAEVSGSWDKSSFIWRLGIIFKSLRTYRAHLNTITRKIPPNFFLLVRWISRCDRAQWDGRNDNNPNISTYIFSNSVIKHSGKHLLFITTILHKCLIIILEVWLSIAVPWQVNLYVCMVPYAIAGVRKPYSLVLTQFHHSLFYWLLYFHHCSMNEPHWPLYFHQYHLQGGHLIQHRYNEAYPVIILLKLTIFLSINGTFWKIHNILCQCSSLYMETLMTPCVVHTISIYLVGENVFNLS